MYTRCVSRHKITQSATKKFRKASHTSSVATGLARLSREPSRIFGATSTTCVRLDFPAMADVENNIKSHKMRIHSADMSNTTHNHVFSFDGSVRRGAISKPATRDELRGCNIINIKHY